jgi:hypothetical protein
MSHLNCQCPEHEDIVDLDSFDLAFMIMTGRVTMKSPLQALADVIKANKDVMLWGPQARLLYQILNKEWQKEIVPYLKIVRRAFQWSEETVDIALLDSALEKHSEMGVRVWKRTKKKSISALELCQRKAIKYFEKQRKEAEKIEYDPTDWEAFLVYGLADHLEEFVRNYPERILHPEIRRMAELMHASTELTPLDLQNMQARLAAAERMVARYQQTLSDIQVGRMWNFTGIEIAQQHGVKTYVIVAHYDRRTCPVCRRLDGKTGDVGPVHSRMLDVLATSDADTINRMMPFPRLNDVDRLPPEAIHSMGLTPPFHSRCRCEIVFGWREI